MERYFLVKEILATKAIDENNEVITEIEAFAVEDLHGCIFSVNKDEFEQDSVKVTAINEDVYYHKFAPHQQRVVDERNELFDKSNALKSFFEKETFSELDKEEQLRLKKQYTVMRAYLSILNDRINNF